MPADSIYRVIINRYEEEINKRTAAENDFVLLKKVKHFFFLTTKTSSFRGCFASIGTDLSAPAISQDPMMSVPCGRAHS